MLRVGMLTSGGDCQSLNATMRGIGKALFNYYGDKVEIIGFLDGYKGLMHNEYKELKPRDFSGILDEGGTILGTSRQPFKMMRVVEDGFEADVQGSQTGLPVCSGRQRFSEDLCAVKRRRFECHRPAQDH